MICGNPARPRHEIADDARKVELQFSIDWGDDDVRDSHTKPLTFCSFACLSEWAAAKSGEHDGVAIVDGAATDAA